MSDYELSAAEFRALYDRVKHDPGTSPGPASGLSFAMDRIAMNIHGNADSHIDALCHVIFDGTLYNGLAIF